jgi:hypothetical protein
MSCYLLELLLDLSTVDRFQAADLMLHVARGVHLDSSYLLLFLSDAAAIPFDSPLNSTQQGSQIEACGIERR